MGNCCVRSPQRGGPFRGSSIQLSTITVVGRVPLSSSPGVPQTFVSEISGYHVEVAYQRSQGRRDHQEDFVSLCTLNSKVSSQVRHDDMLGPPGRFNNPNITSAEPEILKEDDERNEPDVEWFAVFDGHGGDRVSEFCAQGLQDDFLWRYSRLKEQEKTAPSMLMKILTDSFLSFDEEIKRLPPKERTVHNKNCIAGGTAMTYMQSANSSGSTATVLTLTKTADDDALLSVAHAGDSRLVLFSVDNLPTVAPADAIQQNKPEAAGGSFFGRNTARWRYLGATNVEESVHTVANGAVTPLTPKQSARMRRVLRGKQNRTMSKNVKTERYYATLDHQPSDRSEALRVVKDGGQVINNRVNGVLAVSRALGDADQKELRGLIAMPDTFSISLKELHEGGEDNAPPASNVNNLHTSFKTLRQQRKNVKSEDEDEEGIISPTKDVIVIMASDGLWMYATSDMVQGDVTELLSRGFSLQQICQILMEKIIIDEKGLDNTSIVIIRLSKNNIPADFLRSGSVGSFGSFQGGSLSVDVDKLRANKKSGENENSDKVEHEDEEKPGSKELVVDPVPTED